MTATTATPVRGRPRLPASTGEPHYESALFKFVESRLPHYVVRGRLSVNKLASDIELSAQSVYKWFRTNRITPAGAQKLVNVSQGRMSLTDLVPYLVSN